MGQLLFRSFQKPVDLFHHLRRPSAQKQADLSGIFHNFALKEQGIVKVPRFAQVIFFHAVVHEKAEFFHLRGGRAVKALTEIFEQFVRIKSGVAEHTVPDIVKGRLKAEHISPAAAVDTEDLVTMDILRMGGNE